MCMLRVWSLNPFAINWIFVHLGDFCIMLDFQDRTLTFLIDTRIRGGGKMGILSNLTPAPSSPITWHFYLIFLYTKSGGLFYSELINSDSLLMVWFKGTIDLELIPEGWSGLYFVYMDDIFKQPYRNVSNSRKVSLNGVPKWSMQANLWLQLIPQSSFLGSIFPISASPSSSLFLKSEETIPEVNLMEKDE